MRSGLTLSWTDPASESSESTPPKRTLIVDTSQDLRAQCLRFGVHRVDAVLYTHTHADHIFGLDDLRTFNFRQETNIDCYGSEATLGTLRRTFPYVFDGLPPEGGGKPSLNLKTVREPFSILGLPVEPIPVFHGSLEVFGYRFGDFAYVTDTNLIPEPSMEKLDGVHTLILDALRYRPHPTHFSVSEALEVIERLGVERAYLTHLNHEVDYNAPEVEMPPGVELAYDGLSFDV